MSSSYAEHQEKISKIFEMPNFLPLQNGQKLLEFGCGVGALSRYVALNSPESLITAMDINQELINLAKIKTHEQNLSNINFLQADANSVKDLSKDYDGAYCRFLLEEFTEPTKVIETMSQFVRNGGWVCAYERLNSYCRLYPYSESVSLVWNAIYEFYKNSYGASPFVAETLQDHFVSAGLKNVNVQGFSRILSRQIDMALFSWYIEAALTVIGKMREQLVKSEIISEQTLARALEDYKNLLNSSSSFILEVTICVKGTK